MAARTSGQPTGILARVTVTPKRGILDPQGKAVQQSLHALGFPEVGEVRVGKYVELRLRDVDRAAATNRVQAMCEQLLANGMIEDFRLEIVEGAG
jgi:phosphoribosylformylglycinamidine synthase PurS subunit